MGSIDARRKTSVLYVNKCDQHFVDLSEGRDYKGRYAVGSASQVKTVRTGDNPKVTPVAQAMKMAQSELKRKVNVIRGGKQQAENGPGPPENLLVN